MSKAILGKGNFIDNKDGSYTAIKNITIDLDDQNDKFTVQRTVGSTDAPVTTAGVCCY